MISHNKEQSAKTELENYFEVFRTNTIGYDFSFQFANGIKKIVYADWIASGRLYKPIEHAIQTFVGPMIANTHSFSSETGKASTYAYQHSRQLIKKHVNANSDDILIAAQSGMTGVLAQLQRIMGIRYSDVVKNSFRIERDKRPVVFITHMEHHSNQVSWMETIADVVIVPPDENNQVCLSHLEKELKKYKNRQIKIGAFTACSNVTGIVTPYHQLAKIMHRYDGFCIVDFAASAPYLSINMHPECIEERLDAVLFSPHKFLGGPGSCGVLVFNKDLYVSGVPDAPGGGNVKWTDPWGGYGYFDNIEIKEDGGTPGILQTIRAAMAIRLKEKMGVKNMELREKELLELCFSKIVGIPGLHILGDVKSKRIGCVSFIVENLHYNLIVRLLNDKFGIQVRGGWSCASTYAHYLFSIDQKKSKEIINELMSIDLSNKPGWIRLSIHPIMTIEEVLFICSCIEKVIKSAKEWEKDYRYNPKTNEFESKIQVDRKLCNYVEGWFD